AIAQAQAAQAATKKATVAGRKATALLEAKSQADDAAEKAVDELNRVRVETAEQLAAYQTTIAQVQTTARAELDDARAAAAKTVTDAHEATEAAIQQAIADRDPILADRAELRQQLEQAKADAQAQVKAIQDQADAARVEAEQLVKTLRDELANASNAATHAELDQ